VTGRVSVNGVSKRRTNPSFVVCCHVADSDVAPGGTGSVVVALADREGVGALRGWGAC
jgi:hypothetical protein